MRVNRVAIRPRPSAVLDVARAACLPGYAQLLLVDSVLLGGLCASRQSGLPTVALAHSPHEFYAGPWAHSPIGIATGEDLG